MRGRESSRTLCAQRRRILNWLRCVRLSLKAVRFLASFTLSASCLGFFYAFAVAFNLLLLAFAVVVVVVAVNVVDAVVVNAIVAVTAAVIGSVNIFAAAVSAAAAVVSHMKIKKLNSN